MNFCSLSTPGRRRRAEERRGALCHLSAQQRQKGEKKNNNHKKKRVCFAHHKDRKASAFCICQRESRRAYASAETPRGPVPVKNEERGPAAVRGSCLASARWKNKLMKKKERNGMQTDRICVML